MTFRNTGWSIFVALAVIGCGGEGGTEPPTPTKPRLSLSVIAGTTQHALAGQELPAAIGVQVVDLNHVVGGSPAPVAGQIVTWVVTSGGGTVSGPVTTTGADGTAFQRWTLGMTGAQTLEARAIDSETGEKITFQTVAATIDLPAVSSVTVTPREIVAWAGNRNPPFSVVVKNGSGAVDPSIPVTIVSRNVAVGALYEGSAAYAGPDVGTTYYVFEAGGVRDSLKVTTVARDTSVTYRPTITVSPATFTPKGDTGEVWHSKPFDEQALYFGDSAVKVVALWTFPMGIPASQEKWGLCKAEYTITVNSGELGVLHPGSGSETIVYPGCDPYAFYTFKWKIRAKDQPPGNPVIRYFTITVCPKVEHPICSTKQINLNE